MEFPIVCHQMVTPHGIRSHSGIEENNPKTSLKHRFNKHRICEGHVCDVARLWSSFPLKVHCGGKTRFQTSKNGFTNWTVNQA
jgi:hypothetical protein